MTDTEQMARGEEAERILNHPLVKEFFDKAEEAVVQTWRESDIHDEAGQRMCKLLLRAQQNLRDQFETCIRNGKISARQLMQANDPTKPRRQHG